MRRPCATPDARDRGFTLIELLVVIIVVGILAAIAIPVFLNQRKKAVDASLKADLTSLAKAEESWLVDHPQSPGTQDVTALAAEGFRKTGQNSMRVALNPTRGGYCIWASNLGDSVGAAAGWAVFYDSLAGGFLNDGRHIDWDTARVGPGACGPGLSGIVYF